MKSGKTIAYLVSGLLTFLCAIFLFAAAMPAQEVAPKSDKGQKPAPLIRSLKGEDIFHAYCASCHGADGRGQGPVAPALIVKVPDLTVIAKRNGGIFPTQRVQLIISGEETIAPHGSREMPVWGPIFHQIELDRDYGNVRLHNLTKHLETIQQK